MDRRIRYTKMIIKEALIQLLNTKDINKITVSEICKIADINRATFYRYYLDVYDLIDKVKDEFSKEIITALQNVEDNYSMADFLKKMLTIFFNNKDLVKILFTVQNNLYFFNDILDITYTLFKNKWINDLDSIDNEEIEYATVFIFNGSLGIINYWIKSDFEQNIDEIAHVIETLSYYGIKKFIYKK